MKQVVLKNYGYCLHNARNVYDLVIKLTSIKLGNLSSKQLWNETLFFVCWLLDMNVHTWEFPSTTWDQGQIILHSNCFPHYTVPNQFLWFCLNLGEAIMWWAACWLKHLKLSFRNLYAFLFFGVWTLSS